MSAIGLSTALTDRARRSPLCGGRSSAPEAVHTPSPQQRAQLVHMHRGRVSVIDPRERLARPSPRKDGRLAAATYPLSIGLSDPQMFGNPSTYSAS